MDRIFNINFFEKKKNTDKSKIKIAKNKVKAINIIMSTAVPRIIARIIKFLSFPGKHITECIHKPKQ